ncbi:hypothetical protein S40293_09693 [Stachybotrys chartarum IBT 40293]|nr:hypothetical protein S40293_09693 [Stachybotrys chartarum IBT 40293]
MLSHSRLHHHDSATSDLKTTWLSAISTKPTRAESGTSEDENPPDSVINHDVSTLALDNDAETGHLRKTLYSKSHHHHNHPLYDTSALWKYDKDHVENPAYTAELDIHMQRAIDRYTRSVGCSLDFKRTVTSKNFLTMVTNERLRYMPDKGSRLDKILKRAESFGIRFNKIMLSLMQIEMQIEMPTYESSALVLSSCKTLLGLAGRYSYAVEKFFTVLDKVTAVIVAMSKNLDSEHQHSHHGIYSIFQASLAMVVDVFVDITASFGGQKTGTKERTIVTQFESRSGVILARFTRLRAEFYLQTLVHWCDRGVSSTETLFLLRRGFEDSRLILQPICISSSRWFRFFWVSREASSRMRRLLRAVVRGIPRVPRHPRLIRARIEFAKILQLDEVRYTEAVFVYEELSHYDLHSFGKCREEFLGLIEITKYRLSLLFESRPDLSHRAETLLINTYDSLKLKLCYSDEQVIIALARIVEYRRKQKRQGSISAAIKVIEEYILGLLVEERKKTMLFDVARTLAKMYRELASVEVGIKFIQHIKGQVVSGEHTVIEGHCGFGYGQIAHLDRRCFVFIHAFGQLLWGYEREKMLDEIIRDIYTKTCLYEAWSVSLRQTSRAIHVRLAVGARLVAFLEKKGQHAKAVALAFRILESFSRRRPAVADVILLELQPISTEILVEVLKVGQLDIELGTIPFGQLNVIIRFLRERKNFSMLEHILQLKWACQQKGDGYEEESLYKSLLHKASDYFHGHAGHDLTEPNEIMAAVSFFNTLFFSTSKHFARPKTMITTTTATFHPFPALPFDFRARTWELTVESRIVETVDWTAHRLPPMRHLSSSTAAPAQLQTCREAREHLTTHLDDEYRYEKAFFEITTTPYDGFDPVPKDDLQQERYVWLNFDNDMVAIGDTDLSNFRAVAHQVCRLRLERALSNE